MSRPEARRPPTLMRMAATSSSLAGSPTDSIDPVSVVGGRVAVLTNFDRPAVGVSDTIGVAGAAGRFTETGRCGGNSLHFPEAHLQDRRS